MNPGERRLNRAAAAGADGAEALDVAVIGAGPAGLAAAEAASAAGRRVVVFDWTPSPARKLLMAGKSGLNIANVKAGAALLAQYGEAATTLAPALRAFGSEAVRAWCAALGQETFVGSGGRVFPTAMKASPLLRAWLARLDAAGVALRRRWRWTGFDEAGRLRFETDAKPRVATARAVVLALGGASWPRLGSDAAWVSSLREIGVDIAPFAPSNVGYEVAWSAMFAERYAGAPVKSAALSVGSERVDGEFVVARYGVEGGAVYALGGAIRRALDADQGVVARIDLAPRRSVDDLAAAFARRSRKESLATRLRKAARLEGVKAALLRETTPDLAPIAQDPAALAVRVKATPLHLTRPRPIAEAISSAGGVAWSALDASYMLRAAPGVFCAGEMIDWDAPTGGYLLTACLATGRRAGAGAARWAATGDGDACSTRG